MPVHHSNDRSGNPRPYPGAPRADEVPSGVQAIEQAEARQERTARGRWTKGASTTQRKGGRALKGRTILSHRAGVDELVARADFKPRLRQAKAFARAEIANLARTMGGGEVSPGPASIIMSASLQLAASRYLFESAATSGDPDVFQAASRLADASRNNLLSAAELVAKEAKARGKRDPHAALVARVRAAATEKGSK